ncbi:lipopolysaccharide-binding protein precursor [Oryctolagus cuniculus]|uniref:Lipopolysaccharide-binding protein n=1 Tax=Oryctolagus cuniculus TaxID=9986 RepID=G1T5S1_RABIT|nr:lipopolysaccharide-binding protein precursor [Oryctolagus cuniculus]
MGTWARALLGSTLLSLLLAAAPGALGTNPGLITRITDKGLEYAAREGLLALQRKLLGVTLPDFDGDFRIKHLGRAQYKFYSLEIPRFELLRGTLRPLPGQGLSLDISDAYIHVRGSWKVRKAFLRLKNSFDLYVKGLTISVHLVLGSEPSGRPTVTTSSCSSDIQNVELDIEGDLEELLNLLQSQIDARLREVLESKICRQIEEAVTAHLQPYLQTLPVTTQIDSFAGIDYSLMEAPRATAGMLDVMFKGEIFPLDHRSPVDFLAPAMNLPEAHSRMVYFAISDYVFNTASLAYHKSGYWNFSITDAMVPADSNIRLTTKSFRAFVPRLAKLYPNMNLELQGSVASAPLVNLSPENLFAAPQMDIEAFVVLPSSAREPVFRLGVATNVSATLTLNTSKITGFLKPGRLQVELKESKVGGFNVELLEALLNYYILNNLYPKVNEKLAHGLPLPLLRHIQLYDLLLQTHENFLLVGANIQYRRV